MDTTKGVDGQPVVGRPTLRLVVMFLAYTGVRLGAIPDLRVGRLDLPRRRALIAKSVTPAHGRGLVWARPRPTATRGPDAGLFVAEL